MAVRLRFPASHTRSISQWGKTEWVQNPKALVGSPQTRSGLSDRIDPKVRATGGLALGKLVATGLAMRATRRSCRCFAAGASGPIAFRTSISRFFPDMFFPGWM